MLVLHIKMTDVSPGFLRESQALSSQTLWGEGEGTHGIWKPKEMGGNQLKVLQDGGGSSDCVALPVT